LVLRHRNLAAILPAKEAVTLVQSQQREVPCYVRVLLANHLIQLRLVPQLLWELGHHRMVYHVEK
jgi:hypothetical protein